MSISRVSTRGRALSLTPSELRLQRLQDMYNVSLAHSKRAAQSIKKAPSLLAKTMGVPAMVKLHDPWEHTSNLSLAAADSKTSRIKWSRVIGNAYSFTNTSKTVGRPPSQSDSTHSSKVAAGRNYGNQQSAKNSVSLRKRLASHSNASIGSSDSKCGYSMSSPDQDYGQYYTWKQRLLSMEKQKEAIVRSYGKDAYMDEYADVLEKCWRFEGTHPSVQKFATHKIGNVLSEFEKMKVNKPSVSNTKPVSSGKGKKDASKPIKSEQDLVPKVVKQHSVAEKVSQLTLTNKASELTLTNKASQLTLTNNVLLNNLVSSRNSSTVVPTISVKTTKSKSIKESSSTASKVEDVESFLINETELGEKAANAPPPSSLCELEETIEDKVIPTSVVDEPSTTTTIVVDEPPATPTSVVDEPPPTTTTLVPLDELLSLHAPLIDRNTTVAPVSPTLSANSDSGESAAFVLAATGDETLAQTAGDESFQLDIQRAASILSSIVERDDISSQFVVSKNEDNDIKVQIVGDHAVELANELLSNIVTKCVETIMTSTSSHEPPVYIEA